MREKCLRRFIPALIGIVLLPLTIRVQAQVIDDLTVRYTGMMITKTEPDYLLIDGALYRHNMEVVVGRGPLSLGMIYQVTDKRGDLAHALPEQGVMLVGGYDHVLSHRVRLEGYARIGLTRGTNYANPLYATDTDLRVNLVTFHPDGVGWLADKPFFPSAYVGGILNQFGRVQGIGGAGVWWNHFGTYLTAFYALNGVEDPVHPGVNADRTAAYLNNGGVSFSLSYEIKDFQVRVKRNMALKNGGNDLSLALQYRFFFGE